MNEFCRYRKYDNEPVKFLVNPVRCVEAVLCLGCLALAIYMVVELTYMYVSFRVIIAVTAGAFASITIIDIISNSHYDPIFWNSWILFAIAAAVCFTLCCGLLLATSTGFLTILVVGEAVNGVTAIIFLIDSCFVLCMMRRKQTEVSPTEATAVKDEEPMKETAAEELLAEETYDMESLISEEPSVERRPSRSRSPETLYKSSTSLQDRSKRSSRSQIQKIYVGPDGKPYLSDGTPLTPVRDVDGQIFYRTPSGMMFTSEGIPICPGRVELAPCPSAPCAPCPSKTEESKMKDAKRSGGSVKSSKSDKPAPSKPPDRRRKSSRDSSRDQPRDRTRERPQEQPCPAGVCAPSAPCAQDKPCASDQQSQGKSKSPCPTASGAPCNKKQPEESKSPCPAGPCALRGPCAPSVLCARHQQDSPGSSSTESQPRREEESKCSSPRDGPEPTCARSPCAPCAPCSPERTVAQVHIERRVYEQGGVAIQSIRSTERIENDAKMKTSTTSRTVAISTRMVPKVCPAKSRCLSAPGTQETPRDTQRRPIKSADETQASPTAAVLYQYQQQQPSAIYHQYYQRPCPCGKMHYQTATTVHGTVVATSCPFYAQQQQQLRSSSPEKSSASRSPTRSERVEGWKKPEERREPTVRLDTPRPREQESRRESQEQRDTRRTSIRDGTEAAKREEIPIEVCVPPQVLQTISECEGETESSTWGPRTTSDVSSSQLTSSENVGDFGSCDKCYVCGDRQCTVHKQRPRQRPSSTPAVPTGTDEVQTSETRMIRARDLQALQQKPNLPGSTDAFDK